MPKFRQALWGLAFAALPVAHAAQAQPNIVVIMADDMGFADTGAFGGEINTPNIDALANRGIRYTQMYNTGRCSPSRASLLTGQYSHNVGMGHLPSTNYNSSSRGNGTMPGYSGWFAGSDPLEAPDLVPTMPQVLGDAGYDTYMTGKWHLTRSNTLNSGPNGTWPTQLGFDQHYGTMEGAKDYFRPGFFVDSSTPQTFEDTSQFPSDYFYTNDMARQAADFITAEANDGDNNPFLLYQAFYAPHFPLQAPANATDADGNNLVQKYQAVYAQGWDAIRQQRLQEQINMGVLPADTDLSARPSSIPAWNSLSQADRDDLTLRMAIYAAQVEILDQGVGKIVEALEDSGELDNTLIVFLSDNGGADAGGADGRGDASNWDSAAQANNVTYGSGWANVSDAPFRLFKTDNHEGGISSPLIMSGAGIDPSLYGSIDTETMAHIIDLMPTFMDVAGAGYTPGADASELEGTSLASTFNGTGDLSDRDLFFEHEGNRAARSGDWKLVARGENGPWELYNIADDRIEENNLSLQRPDIVRELRQAWEAWAERNQVVADDPEINSPFLSNTTFDFIGQRQADPNGLLLHLTFDDASYTDGDTVQDASGNGFNGVFNSRGDNNNHSVASGVNGLGGAFDFDDGDIIDISMEADIPIGPEARSISVWANARSLGSGNRLLGYGRTDGLDTSAFIITMEGTSDDATINLRLDGSVIEFAPSAGNEIGIDEWVHFALIVPDDAASSQEIRMFINGEEVLGALTAGDYEQLVTGISSLGIGMRGGLTPGGFQTANAFDGLLGDLQLYGTELNPEQVAFLYNNPGQSVVIPEPATALLGLAGGGLLMLRRKR